MDQSKHIPIYLCGFMGSGKSHCGRNAARRLNLRFLDLDLFIRKKHGMTIPEIFSRYGEKKFREYEYNALKTNLDFDIVSLGGGVLTYEKSRSFIKKNGKVVFIDTDFETCFERINNDPDRPLAVGKSKEELLRFYNERFELYKNAAGYFAHGEDTVTELIAKLKGKNYRC